MSINFKTAMWGEVKTDIYAGDNCDEHKPFIEVLCDGDMESDTTDELAIHANRWPVGTKITVEIPCCPDCGLDAEYQDNNGKCECDFDWKIWAECQYS